MKDRHLHGIILLLVSASCFISGMTLAEKWGQDKLVKCWAESTDNRLKDMQLAERATEAGQQAVDAAKDCYKALNAILPSADAGVRPVAKK